MATRTIANGGGNWDVAGTWVEGVVPTAADVVVATATSGNLTIPAAVTALARSVDFTSYVAVFTFAAASSVLTVGDASGGALKFAAGMTVTLTGVGTINLVSTSSNGGAGWGITTAGKTLPNVTFNGAGGKWVLQDALTAADAAIVIVNLGTLDTANMSVTAGQFQLSSSGAIGLTLGSSVITLSGNAGGAVTINAGAASSNVTVAANTATFNVAGVSMQLAGVNWNGASVVCAAWNTSNRTISTTGATVGNLSISGIANKGLLVSLAGNLTVTGTLTLTGNSAVNRPLVQSNTLGTARTITAGAVAFTNVDFMDITIAGAAAGAAAGTSVGDAGGNTGITFTATTTQTWQGTAGGNWSDVTKWTSRVPLPQDDVIIASVFVASPTIALDMPRLGRSINFTGTTGTPSLGIGGMSSWSMYGSLTLAVGMAPPNLGGNSFQLRGRGPFGVTTAGVSPAINFEVVAPGGTYTLQDALTITPSAAGVISHVAGTLNTNGMTVTAWSYSTSGATTRALTLGASVVNLVATTGTVWGVSGTGFSLSAASSTIAIASASASLRTFAGFGLTYGALVYTVANSPGALVVTGANTFASLNVGAGRTLTLPSSTVTTVTGTATIAGTQQGYLYLPGASGSYVSTPDVAGLDVPADLDVVARVALSDWTPAVVNVIAAKEGSSTTRSWRFTVNTDGRLALTVSTDGTATTGGVGGSAPVIADGSWLWVRATRVAATGVITYYSCADQATEPTAGQWTQLGTTVASTIGSINNSTSVLEVGSRSVGTAEPLAGKVGRVIVKDGIAGAVVADYDASAHVPTSDTYTGATGKVWTLNGLAKQGLGRVTLNSSTPGTKSTLTGPAIGMNAQYVELVDQTGTPTGGPSVFYAYESTVSNTTGWVAAHAITMSGLDQSIGSANLLRLHPVSGSGADQSIGSANLLRLHPMSAAGVDQSTGALNLLRLLRITAAGVDQSAGSANLLRLLRIAGSGTDQTAGAANLLRLLHVAGSGSSQSAGGLNLLIRHILAAAGVDQSTGALNLLRLHPVTGAGVQRTLGALNLLRLLIISAAGADSSAGAFELSVAKPITGAGASHTSGRLEMLRLLRLIASGHDQTAGALAMLEIVYRAIAMGVTVSERAVYVELNDAFGRPV